MDSDVREQTEDSLAMQSKIDAEPLTEEDCLKAMSDEELLSFIEGNGQFDSGVLLREIKRRVENGGIVHLTESRRFGHRMRFIMNNLEGRIELLTYLFGLGFDISADRVMLYSVELFRNVLSVTDPLPVGHYLASAGNYVKDSQQLLIDLNIITPEILRDYITETKDLSYDTLTSLLTILSSTPSWIPFCLPVMARIIDISLRESFTMMKLLLEKFYDDILQYRDIVQIAQEFAMYDLEILRLCCQYDLTNFVIPLNARLQCILFLLDRGFEVPFDKFCHRSELVQRYLESGGSKDKMREIMFQSRAGDVDCLDLVIDDDPSEYPLLLEKYPDYDDLILLLIKRGYIDDKMISHGCFSSHLRSAIERKLIDVQWYVDNYSSKLSNINICDIIDLCPDVTFPEGFTVLFDKNLRMMIGRMRKIAEKMKVEFSEGTDEGNFYGYWNDEMIEFYLEHSNVLSSVDKVGKFMLECPYTINDEHLIRLAEKTDAEWIAKAIALSMIGRFYPRIKKLLIPYTTVDLVNTYRTLIGDMIFNDPKFSNIIIMNFIKNTGVYRSDPHCKTRVESAFREEEIKLLMLLKNK